jgi:hypothetical protein
MVVRDLDVVEIDGAELLQLRDQKVRVALPASAARVGRTAPETWRRRPGRSGPTAFLESTLFRR